MVQRDSYRGLAGALKTLDPAYFGFVMSTGIVSIAFHEMDMAAIAVPLGIFNVGCYLILLVLFGARLGVFPNQVVLDLRDSEQHWGTLTFVVGTNTVGIQFLSVFDTVGIAVFLWLLTVFVTPLLLYYLFAIEFIGVKEVNVSERLDGAFLLVIVCMQSLAILGGLLADSLANYTELLTLFSMAYFGSGYILYFVIVTIVTYRLLSGKLDQEDWTGPYWITMGAAAITTLAGTTIGPQLESVTAWDAYAPVVLGVTFLAWAIASWWIPLLLGIDVWKFVTGGIKGQPPVWVLVMPWSRLAFGRTLHTYTPGAWGRVFPMGMYTACTLGLAGTDAFSLVHVIPQYWGWFALSIWVVTLVGTLRALGDVLINTHGKEETASID